MPISPKQLQANRHNALASTGPRGAAGKAASSHNALRHGLLSRQLLLRDEDPAGLDRLSQGLQASIAPVGALEQLLLERIVAAAWRLRRLARIQAGVLDWRLHTRIASNARWQQEPARYRAANQSDDAPSGPAFDLERDAELVCQTDTCALGAAFIDEIDSLSSLSRYEAALERSLHRALRAAASSGR